ncbi:hypothetical protein V8D89_015889 [Ganoderma adspersum]
MQTPFAALLSAVAVAATSHASLLPRDPTFCPEATIISTSSIGVGELSVELAKLSCGPPANNLKRQVAPSTTRVVAAAAPTNVCNEPCTNACASVGPLPPMAEDCQTIVDAINIFYGSIPTTFEVAANHAQTLTFGTCRFFFENLSAKPVEYCWMSLAQVASAAAAACLPPVQPVQSEGLCLSPTAPWQVGVAHS